MTDKLGDRLCAVQVKVRRDIGSDGGWHMGQKHEELVSPNLFYSLSILENRSPTSRKHGSFRAELSPNLSRKFIRIGCTRLERRGSSAMTAPSDASCPITIPCLSTSWDGSTLTLKIGRPSKPRLGSDARTEVAISLKFGRTSNLVMTPLRHTKF
ncbi:MAG: hypothetical protein JHD07_32885 [Bradyrhizobium sp.]|nr:hypothetical protein [Bradyrhizobium sp.]